MISLKLIWASARSATPGTLHKTLGASRTLNHHCPVQAKAVVESRGADMHCPDVTTCHWDTMAHYNSDVLYPCSDVVAAWLNDILGME